MTSSNEKCGLGSLLPMSCRERAEAFARRLHNRLTSLDSEDINGVVNESSWLAAHENSLQLSQPRQSDKNSETEFYVNLGTLESPGSPDEELDGTEFEKFVNGDNFTISPNKLFTNYSTIEQHDSDSSDGTFYDTQAEVIQQIETEANKPYNLSTQNQSNVGFSIVPEDETTELDLSLNSIASALNEGDICNTKCNPSTILCEKEFNRVESKYNGTDKETDNTDVTNEYDLSSLDRHNDVEVVVTPCQLEPRKSVPNDIVDEENETEETIPRVRRCSSLKTGKTPPGTPGSKKIVRFADVLGLDLADIRTFLDEIPKVPNSAYNDLRDVDIKASLPDMSFNITSKLPSVNVDKILVPLFQQPGGRPDFIDRIRDNQVCLDNAMVQDPVTLSISGIARVKNLDFHKSVHIRYTLDSWQSFADVQAVYVENSCDGFSDKFSFLIFANNLAIGQKLEFAIRFQCKGYQYWDNNNGSNYCFQCLPPRNHSSCADLTVPDESWATNFY